MNRKVGVIDSDIFDNCLNQIIPNKEKELSCFEEFVGNKYGIKSHHRHEDAFYFYRLSRCVILHGYGEPLLDPHIVRRVQACTDRKIPTYFSTVAANIDLPKMISLMAAGLDVIKFSIDSLTDEGQRAIRGKKNNFRRSFETIEKILEYKQAHPEIKTEIVVTMISFSQNEADFQEQASFMALWDQYPVYAYIKSQDNRWYYKEDDALVNRSHYEKQYCEFPWSSLSIMSNGDVVPCTQDYDAEMKMGNIGEQRLKDIWNSQKYQVFRRFHVTGHAARDYKCRDRCDLPKLFHKLSFQDGR